jgi:hypothetical protein
MHEILNLDLTCAHHKSQAWDSLLDHTSFSFISFSFASLIENRDFSKTLAYLFKNSPNLGYDLLLMFVTLGNYFGRFSKLFQSDFKFEFESQLYKPDAW